MNARPEWLAAQAEALDRGTVDSDALLPQLGAEGVFLAGVPQAFGGSGGDVNDGIAAIAAVAEVSLTAAFVAWGQRAYIEYLLQSPNLALRNRSLPALLAGTHAGATGLSNAMKFLCGIETLQIAAQPVGQGFQLDGRLPWVTNLRKTGFSVAAAISRADGAPPFIAALDSSLPGVQRSDDLELLALRGSNTAAIDINTVSIDADAIIHDNAREYLPRVRPAFLGLQCGLSIGLARSALRQAASAGEARLALQPRIDAEQAALAANVAALTQGLRDGRFLDDAVALFRLRIALAANVQAAVALELEATGGRAYLQAYNADFARRWHEAAFIPVVTPSLSQLHGELQKHAARCAGTGAA